MTEIPGKESKLDQSDQQDESVEPEDTENKHLPFKLLKSQTAADPKSEAMRFKIRLFWPSFECFLLVRVRAKRPQSGVISLHFAGDNPSFFRHSELELPDEAEDGATIDFFGTIDAPLDPSQRWEVRVIRPNRPFEVLGWLETQELGVWRFTAQEGGLAESDRGSSIESPWEMGGTGRSSGSLALPLRGPVGRTGSWKGKVKGAIQLFTGSRKLQADLGTAEGPDWDGSGGHQTRRTLGLVGGAPKSGTTWVQRILNSHPLVLSIGENGLFRPALHTRFSELFSAHPPPWYATGISHQSPFTAQAYIAQCARMVSTLEQLGAAANVDFALDKTPGYSANIREILETVPQLRYIHCLRDPLDVFVSRFFHERELARSSEPGLAAGKIQSNQSIRYHLENADVSDSPHEMFQHDDFVEFLCSDYAALNSVVRFARNDSRIHLVVYEKMKSDFDAEARKLFGFLGIKVSPIETAEIARQNSFQTYTGGRKEGEEAQREFYRKGIVGDHRSYMTDDQRHRILERLEDHLPGITDLRQA